MEMVFAFMYPALASLGTYLLPVAPVVYLVLRWRAYREGSGPDPQLGVKSVLYFFRTLGYHVILAGEFCLLFGLMNAPLRWQLLRICLALLLAGGLVYGVHVWFLARRTNTAERPAVARLYNGLNLVLCGLVGLGSLVGSLVALLSEEIPWETLQITAGLLVVYGSAWLAQTALLVRRSPLQPAP